MKKILKDIHDFVRETLWGIAFLGCGYVLIIEASQRGII